MHKLHLYAFGQYVVEMANIVPIVMVFCYAAPMVTTTGEDQLESISNSSSMPLCVPEDNDAVNSTMITPTINDEVIVFGGLFVGFSVCLIVCLFVFSFV